MLFRRLKLRPKLILFFILVGLVPPIVASILSSTLANNVLDKEIRSKMDVYAHDKQYILTQWFENQRKTVGIIASTQDVYQTMNLYYILRGGTEWRYQNNTVLLSLLQKVKKENGYRDLFIVNNDAIIVSSTNEDILEANLSDRDYLKRSLQGQISTSEVFYSDVAKADIIVISAPIYDDYLNGQIIGALAAYLDSSQISIMVEEGLENVGTTADSYLINTDGHLVTLPKFGQGFEVLSTRIDTDWINDLSNALRRGDLDFRQEGVFQNYLGNKVLGSLEIITLGDYPAGMITTVDYTEAFAAVTTLHKLIFAMISVIILVVGFIGYAVAQSLSKPILMLNQGTKEIANGNLTIQIKNNRSDELGDLAVQQNNMVRRIADLIRQIFSSSDLVHQASKEIAVGTQDLSQRTQEQASTLEELASTMEAVNSSIQQVAANSDQADQLSQTTLQVVTRGEHSIHETIEAMEQISDSSKQIAEIIKVVNDIAFQTNLLALNAAVEAARAGEQGRGFAVVAAEVRNLAGRTGESAKEIEKLINESVNRVEKGNQLVNNSSEVLKQIVTNTKRTSDVIVEVAAAMREQSSSSQQIQASLEQLNQVTQENAAMVEELTSSCQTLNAEAETLRQQVDRFKLEDQAKTNESVSSRGLAFSKIEQKNKSFKEDSIDHF